VASRTSATTTNSAIRILKWSSGRKRNPARSATSARMGRPAHQRTDFQGEPILKGKISTEHGPEICRYCTVGSSSRTIASASLAHDKWIAGLFRPQSTKRITELRQTSSRRVEVFSLDTQTTHREGEEAAVAKTLTCSYDAGEGHHAGEQTGKLASCAPNNDDDAPGYRRGAAFRRFGPRRHYRDRARIHVALQSLNERPSHLDKLTAPNRERIGSQVGRVAQEKDKIFTMIVMEARHEGVNQLTTRSARRASGRREERGHQPAPIVCGGPNKR